MAERFVPGRRKNNAVLRISNGDISQQVLHNAGIEAVNFGTTSVQNTVPPQAARLYTLNQPGRRTLKLSRQFDTMIGNTHALMDYASSRGKTREWSQFYAHAHDYAHELSHRYRISHEQASGIIASMSGGGGEWEKNKANAEKFLAAHEAGVVIKPSQLSGVEGSRITNAHRILAGEDPQEVLGDLKEGNFMRSIHNPEGDSLTVDPHLHHGMTGWLRPWRVTPNPEIGRNTGGGGGAPGLQNEHVYHFMAEAVRNVANEHGLSPNEAQSTIWYAKKKLTENVLGSVPPHHPNFESYYPTVRPGARYRKPTA